MKSNQNVLLDLVMGIAMAVIWSAAFVSMMDSPLGIAVGMVFGAVFAVLSRVIFR